MAVETASIGSDPRDKLRSLTQSALVIQSSGDYALSSSMATPKLTPTTILVQVRAVALQPVDAKMPELHGSSLDGCVGGYDFAGVVIAIGAEVQRQQEQSGRSTSALLRLQDRVAGMVFGGNPQQPEVGAFCEIVLADPRFVLRIPDNMSFEQGASLGTAVATTGMALYQSLGLQMPPLPGAGAARADRSSDEWVLVLGGSSSCGTMAIQMLKLLVSAFLFWPARVEAAHFHSLQA
jgi:NADPH:quinone reductase-like Zn-dependent oxidoreductase